MRIPGNGTNGGRFETARTIALPDTGDGDTGTQEGLDHMDQRAGCPTGCIRANVWRTNAVDPDLAVILGDNATCVDEDTGWPGSGSIGGYRDDRSIFG